MREKMEKSMFVQVHCYFHRSAQVLGWAPAVAATTVGEAVPRPDTRTTQTDSSFRNYFGMSHSY